MQLNVWQGALTPLKIQLLDENQEPRDLSSATGVSLVAAKKSNRNTVFTQAGSIVGDGTTGEIEIVVADDALNGVTPSDLDVPSQREHEPTATLYGYISLSDTDGIFDKIYVPDIAIYFNTL